MTLNVTPVNNHMLHLNALATVHWLSPPYPTVRSAILANTPYSAHMHMVIMLVRKKAAKVVSCAARRGRMRETRRRKMMSSGGTAMMLISQLIAERLRVHVER
jgi:hypothetical protein